MTTLTAFQESFDGLPDPTERMRTRIAATVVCSASLILGTASFAGLLDVGSDTITGSAGAPVASEARILGRGGANTGTPCDEQTWPYFEARCLKRVDDARTTARTTPKHGLGAQQVRLQTPPATLDPKPETAVAQESGTTGSAPRADEADTITTGSTPMPMHSIGTDAARQRHDAGPPLSPREERRLQREERTRVQRDRRDEARRARDEQQALRAKNETRDGDKRARRGDDDRIVRRWTEYTYRLPDGRSHRVVVIKRGSLDETFFRNIR